MKQGDETKVGGKTWRLGAVIVVIVAVAAGLYYLSGIQNFLGGSQAPTGEPTVGAPLVLGPVYPEFNPAVSSSITSPTTPDKTSTEELTGRNESVVIYNISAENWAYNPSQLVIKKGKRVNIYFTAVDRDYDLAISLPIGAYVSVKKGEMVTIGFEADKVGTYGMQCEKICPPGKDMKGELVIIK